MVQKQKNTIIYILKVVDNVSYMRCVRGAFAKQLVYKKGTETEKLDLVYLIGILEFI